MTTHLHPFWSQPESAFQNLYVWLKLYPSIHIQGFVPNQCYENQLFLSMGPSTKTRNTPWTRHQSIQSTHTQTHTPFTLTVSSLQFTLTNLFLQCGRKPQFRLRGCPNFFSLQIQCLIKIHAFFAKCINYKLFFLSSGSHKSMKDKHTTTKRAFLCYCL